MIFEKAKDFNFLRHAKNYSARFFEDKYDLEFF
jgi:hypothetical protein